MGMEGASRAAWTRRGLRLPRPWVSHVRFSQAAIPDRLRHSWEAEWAGGGAQTQDQVASLRARVLPLTGWLCVPGQATLLGASASQAVKQGLRTQSQSTPQVSAKRAPAIAKFETLCACPYPLSPGRPCPSFYAGAVDWAAVPFTYTSSGFGANATHGGAGWESRWCGGEYDFVKIILEVIRGAMDQNHSQPPGIPRGRTGDRGRREPLARELDGSIA